MADTQVRDLPRVQTATHSVRVETGAGMRGRVHEKRRPPPPAWRVPVLCALLVGAFAFLVYTVTVLENDSAVEEFYASQNPLPPGNPGDVIRIQQLEPGAIEGALYRVMYHSRSIGDDDIAVTGSIAVPNTPAPIGGRPVVTVGHPTVGNADDCAPSRDPETNAGVINRFLAAGWIVATSDLEGLGTPGVPPYLVGDSEGRSMVDIVRATKNIPAFSSGTTFAAWGHSQGGHAALFTRKVAATWAPELRMVGAVAVAPVSSTSLFVSRANFAGPGITLMTVGGYSAAYGLSANEVLTADGMDHLDDAEAKCLGDLGDELRDRTLDDIRKVDPVDLSDWGSALSGNNAGPIRSNVAVLLLQGDADAIVPESDTEALFTEMCSTTQPVTMDIDEGGGHADVRDRTIDTAVAWLTDRFTLAPASTNCAGKPAQS
jgi:alpha-beta hydrolase superfamily lysophospholipase